MTFIVETEKPLIPQNKNLEQTETMPDQDKAEGLQAKTLTREDIGLHLITLLNTKTTRPEVIQDCILYWKKRFEVAGNDDEADADLMYSKKRYARRNARLFAADYFNRLNAVNL